jgi:histidine triad (HIT) family protein
MEDCVFCRIAAKKVPASVVYEDDEMLAFDDVHPMAPVHVLIIPKEHFASLNDLPEGREGLVGRMVAKARDLAEAKGIGKSGYRVVLNTARDSGQNVFHIHFHVLGGRKMAWPPG